MIVKGALSRRAAASKDEMDGARAPSRSPYLRLPWKRGRIGGHSRKGILALGLILLSYLLLFSESGWIRQWQMRTHKAELLQNVERLELKQERLRQEIWRLEHDGVQLLGLYALRPSALAP